MRRNIILIFFFFASCSMLDRYEYDIDPELQKHVNRFIFEANERGHFFSDRNIRVQFATISGAQGQTNTFTHLIKIDKSSQGWKSNPEALVFHELAHFFLKRGHDNEMYERFPKSIMNSIVDPEWCLDGTEHRRIYYIEELFNRNTPRPDWSFE